MMINQNFRSLSVTLLSAVLMTACGHLPLPDNATQHQSPINPLTEASMTNSIHTINSRYDFDDTVNRLQSTFKDKGMTIFAVIDHQKAAKDTGLTMQPATVIIFGTPKAGTPLMKKDPNFALQLPLKVLVSQSNDQVTVSFEDTHSLIANSNIDFDDVKNTLANAEKLIEKTVTQ